jgi:hypothetical protein
MLDTGYDLCRFYFIGKIDGAIPIHDRWNYLEIDHLQTFELDQ